MNSESGLSLIEIAIGMVIIGLLMIPVIENYKQNMIDARRGTTNSNMNPTIETAIQNYYLANNRLPCPANITLNATSASYGTESGAAGSCAGAGVVITGVGPNQIAIGGVPFQALNIPADSTLDGWHNKITYAVTVFDTTVGFDPFSVAPAAQAITLKKFQYNPPVPASPGPPPVAAIPASITLIAPAPTAYYVLVSYGDDGAGAYTADGVLYAPCPIGGPSPPAEVENCDNKNTTFLANDYARSLAPGATYYDDSVGTKTLNADIWSYSPSNNDNIFSNGYVGINNPAPAYPLDVNGNLKTTGASGDVAASTLCDSAGANCFPAKIVGGTGMGVGLSDPVVNPNCSNVNNPNGAMTGVANADAVCGNPQSFAVGKTFTCPVGQYVYGVDAGGNVKCR